MKKQLLFLVALLTGLSAWAQQDIVTYNKEDKQVMLSHVNAENTFETLAIIDANDFNTVRYDKEGRVTELTNSLGSLYFEYNDDWVDVTYNIDGHTLARCYYHYKDDKAYQELAAQMQDWSGKFNTTDRVVNFMNSEAFKKSYEFLDNTLDHLNNPVKVLYDDVLRKAIYGKKENMNGMDQAFDDMVSIVLKLSKGFVNNLSDEIIMNPRKHFDNFVSYLHNLHRRMYDRQKSNNKFEMSWRQGLWDKVSNGEITIEEATAKVNDVLAKKALYEKEHPNKFTDILIEVETDAETGEEVIRFIEVAKTSDGALMESRAAEPVGNSGMILKKLDNYINNSEYGRLEKVLIYYNYFKNHSPEEWDYTRQAGDLKLRYHKQAPTFDEYATKWKNPFYKVELYYDNDVDYKNWGTVMVRLWLTPSGSILNTYIEDARYHHNPNEVNFPQVKITGTNWLNAAFDE